MKIPVGLVLSSLAFITGVLVIFDLVSGSIFLGIGLVFGTVGLILSSATKSKLQIILSVIALLPLALLIGEVIGLGGSSSPL